MAQLFTLMVEKLINHHFDEEKSHWEEINPERFGTTLNKTDRFCVNTQFNGLTACIIDLVAKKSVLLQGDDASQFLGALGNFSFVTDDIFDRMCSDYEGVMDPDGTSPHIYDNLLRLRSMAPVTIQKALLDAEGNLEALVDYTLDTECDSFAELFKIEPNVVDEMSAQDILGLSLAKKTITNGIPDAVDHIYQVACYIQEEVSAAKFKSAVIQLGEAIKDGDPQTIADQWFEVEKHLE